MTEPIYGPAGALGFTCFWCKTWFPKAEHDAHAVACPKLVEIFPRGGVWTGVTRPTPEMLAQCRAAPGDAGNMLRTIDAIAWPEERDRLRAENAALRAKLDRVVGVLDGLLVEVKES